MGNAGFQSVLFRTDMAAAVRNYITAHRQSSSRNTWHRCHEVRRGDSLGMCAEDSSQVVQAERTSPKPVFRARGASRARLSRSRGVTMVEIIITLAIVAILTVIAVPSFTGTIQRARTLSEANSLVNDIQYARGEAIKRGLPVSLCASKDGAVCTGANAWDVGWIVFTDVNNSGTVDSANDIVLRVRAGLTSGDTFTATTSSTTSKALTYSRDGFAMNLPNSGTFKVTLSTSPTNATATRCVTVNMVGRAVLTGGACS